VKDSSFVAERLVGASIRNPWLVVGLSVLLTLVCAYVAATRFAITTETDQLLRADSAWLEHKAQYRSAFPHQSKVILVVVDGATPELAENGASRLAEALAKDPGPDLRKAWRPDGGPFFDRNGLLFLPTDQVRETMRQLTEQQPTLLALSGDPSLRGLARLIQIGANQGALEQSAALVGQLGDTVERVLAGEPAAMSWQRLLSNKAAEPGELRRFVLVDPVLDYEALQPSGKATARIRSVAAELGLTPANGTRIRLTGAAPLADEEFASIEEGAPLHLGLTVLAIAVILYLALKSGRIIFAVLATTLAGLVMTVGVGLLMVGRFNVISVAVAALFLGLGVDFGIQVAVRYRDERFRRDDVAEALRASAKGVGWSLLLAAAALLVGFFSFLPTSFKGVSELGLITGVGMIIAFLASLTLLPAIIALLPPPGEPDTVETPWLAAVDHWILGHRKLVIAASTILVVAGLPLLFRLEFDANPMHLRSETTEGVSTFLDLTRQPGMTPYTISVLAPSVDAARPLAARIAALPEVARVVTAATFVPDGQDEKLAIVREAAGGLSGLTAPQPSAPPPTDEDIVRALRGAAAALERHAATGAGGPSTAARTLAASLSRLADATPERRQAAQRALTGGLPILLGKLRTLLAPEPVTLASLPADLRDDWIAADGRARIEVSPKGDANDNAVLERFTRAVAAVAPNVVGGPVDVVESRGVIVKAFVTAAILALAGVFLILTLALRNAKDVALTLGPLVIATILTLETAHLIGMPLNLANIIALPLMLAVGVAFHIYYMIAWRNGMADMLASSLTRAIFFSSMTTGVAFGSLWLSHHPGTASMGKLLTLSLVFTLLAAFVVVPAFLGPPRQAASPPPDQL
jgi:hopanoid biosynthesis associated RND transporter like protein HpnN